MQEEAYPFFNLLSDMGGSLGMFLGMSVLSLVELMEGIAKLYSLYKLKYKGVSNKVQEINLGESKT